MTVTALLGLMVPAVSADETEKPLETVVYRFEGAVALEATAKNTDTVITADAGKTSYSFKDYAMYNALAEAYAKGNIDWKIGLYDGALVTNNNTRFRTDNFNGLRVCMTRDSGKISSVGQWVSFPIATPAAGTYNITLKHGLHAENGIKEVGFYIVSYTKTIGKEDITALLGNANSTAGEAKYLGSYSCDKEGSGEGVVYAATLSGSYTFEQNKNYMIVLKSQAEDDSDGRDQYLYICKTTLTPSIAQVGDTGYASVADAVEAAKASATDKKVTMLQNAEEDTVNVPSGVTLDLNGKTLNATVIANTGSSVTDGSAGSTGKIVGGFTAENTVGANEIALHDGNTTRIVTCAVDGLGTNVVKTGDTVSSVYFRYSVTFDNKEAYQMIADAADDAKFTIGAELSFGGSSEEAVLKNSAVVSDWAGTMAALQEGQEVTFYVCVTGFEDLDAEATGELSVKLWTKGATDAKTYSDPVTYTIGG
jgi:hypothetical protein